MDAEGARALADRIASGPPASEQDGEERDPRADAPLVVRPERARRGEIRVYVIGPDGRLVRRR